MIDDARRLLARLFGAPRPERIVLGYNATDALNMAIKGVSGRETTPSPSVLEHNSINRPLKPAGARRGDHPHPPARDPGPSHRPRRGGARLHAEDGLVAVTHASNVNRNDPAGRRPRRIARERGRFFWSMPAQRAGVGDRRREDAIDLLAFTATRGFSARPARAAWWSKSGRRSAPGAKANRRRLRQPGAPSELPHRPGRGHAERLRIAGLPRGVRLLLERASKTILPRAELLAILLKALRRPERFSFYGCRRGPRERRGEGRVGLLSFQSRRVRAGRAGGGPRRALRHRRPPRLQFAPYTHKAPRHVPPGDGAHQRRPAHHARRDAACGRGSRRDDGRLSRGPAAGGRAAAPAGADLP